MRKLKDFDSEREAERLVDHLLVAEVDSQVRGGEPWEVWVLDDRSMDTARRELERFEAGEGSGHARGLAAKIRRQREQADEGAADRFLEMGSRWRDGEGDAAGLGPLTMFLIAICVLVAFMGDWNAAAQDPLIQQLSVEPWTSTQFLGRVRAGEVWRLVTPMFIHFGLMHLVFNMLWLWQLGREIEHRHGTLAMLGIVLLAQIPSGLGQYLASGPSFGGMSGVVYGLFGFVWMQTRYNRSRRYQLRDDTAVFMMIWFVVCLTGIVGPIANVGHAGGLVAGLLLGAPAYVRHLRDRAANPALGDDGWAGELRGAKAWRKRVFEPYLPLLMLVAAAVAMLVDFWPR